MGSYVSYPIGVCINTTISATHEYQKFTCLSGNDTAIKQTKYSDSSCSTKTWEVIENYGASVGTCATFATGYRKLLAKCGASMVCTQNTSALWFYERWQCSSSSSSSSSSGGGGSASDAHAIAIWSSAAVLAMAARQSW